jgi:RsiW-degrading membrane proteinase PrsW (M82 family)
VTHSNYVPPPPPPQVPTVPHKTGFHGPETRFFTNIRRHLTSLEQPHTQLNEKPKKGLIVALILGATLSFILSFVIQLATGMPATDFALLSIIAPVSEEIFKGLSILLVALFIWKTLPSRRYGAALGAATGLGFAISENIVYSISYALLGGQVINGQVVPDSLIAELIISRWIAIPFMHVLWSAFIGIGIFVLLAQRKQRHTSPGGIALQLLLFGLVNHIIWNTVALALNGIGAFLIVLINILLIFVPFGIMFRDILGGHFNFQTFFVSVSESFVNQSNKSPLPPPPPPV